MLEGWGPGRPDQAALDEVPRLTVSRAGGNLGRPAADAEPAAPVHTVDDLGVGLGRGEDGRVCAVEVPAVGTGRALEGADISGTSAAGARTGAKHTGVVRGQSDRVMAGRLTTRSGRRCSPQSPGGGPPPERRQTWRT